MLGWLFLCLTWAVTWVYYSGAVEDGSVIDGVCRASVVWTLFLYVGTELLSAVGMIGPGAFLGTWMAYFVVIVVMTVKKGRHRICFSNVKRIVSSVRAYSWTEKAVLLFLTALGGVNVIFALLIMPRNMDSMTYHLTRIMYWIEHRSVAYYGAFDPRQLYSPILAEYVNLHVMLLSKSDHFVNMLQNFSAHGCVLLCYGILRRLDVRRSYSLLGLLLLPGMNIFTVEAVTTQVDMFAGFWLMMFVYMATPYILGKGLSIDRGGIGDFSMMGIVAGFLFLAKSNACIPALIVAVFLLAVRIIHWDHKPLVLIPGVIATLCASAVALPVWVRNVAATGNILATGAMPRVTVTTLDIRMLFVNALKNLAFGTTSFWNESLLMDGVRGLGRLLAVDINAPAITFSLDFMLDYSHAMDGASAPLLGVMLLLSLGMPVLLYFRHREIKWIYLVVLSGQLFVTAAVVKFQLWVARLMLPALLLVAVSAAVCLAEVLKMAEAKSRKKGFVAIAAALMLIASMGHAVEQTLYNGYWALWSVRGGSDRETMYIPDAGLAEVFGAIEELEAQELGLALTVQYPFLARYMQRGMHVENVSYVGQEDIEAEINASFLPKAILTGKKSDGRKSAIVHGGMTYEKVGSYGTGDTFTLWRRVDG